MDMSILIIGSRFEWHVYFLLVNLIKMTYLTIYQFERLVKLKKKMTTFVKMTNGWINQFQDI
jgi:hypothetical protein